MKSSLLMPQPYHCPKCSRRVFTVTKLIQHIELIHAHEPNFQISCGLNNCSSSERIPVFLKIKYILNIDTEWVLCGNFLFPLRFEHHLFAFSVRMDEEWILMRLGDEVDRQAYGVYSIDDGMFLAIRHCN